MIDCPFGECPLYFSALENSQMILRFLFSQSQFDHLRYNSLTLALSQKLHVNLLDPYSFIAHSLATQEFPVIVHFIYWFSLHSCQMATSYLSRNMITTRFRHPYRPIGRIFLGRWVWIQGAPGCSQRKTILYPVRSRAHLVRSQCFYNQSPCFIPSL